MKDLKYMGDFIPTIFDMPEVWRLNREAYGRWFNYAFFWYYPIAGLFLVPSTVFCLIARWIGRKP